MSQKEGNNNLDRNSTPIIDRFNKHYHSHQHVEERIEDEVEEMHSVNHSSITHRKDSIHLTHVIGQYNERHHARTLCVAHPSCGKVRMSPL